MSAPPVAEKSAAELRRFGLTVGAGFAVIGLLSWLRGHAFAPRVLWIMAALLMAPAAIVPASLRPVEREWMRAAAILGYVNTRVILTLLFYVVITPIGFVRRIFGDPLDRSIKDGRQSHWIRREREPFDRARYEQQF
jgi:hypothetical protein